MTTRALTVAVALLLVVSGVSATGILPVDVAAGAHDGSVDDDEIVEVLTHSTAGMPAGEEEVTLSYHVGGSILGLEVDLSAEDVEVVELDGFEAAGESRYEWDEQTKQPSITVQRDIAQENDRSEGLDFADAGEWALVDDISTSIRYRVVSGVDVERTVVTRSTNGNATVGGRWLYVGEATHHEFDGEGERFRLVVSDAATLPVSVEAVGSTLRRSSAMLDVAGRSDDLTVFVVTDPIRRGGLATTAGTDLWVHNATLEPPRETLHHEYTHSRQAYRPQEATRWTYEGVAEYYGYLLALQQGHIEYHRFHEALSSGNDYPNAVLADPATWRGTDADYDLGALTLAELDAEMRNASDGDATVEDAFRAMNTHDGPVTDDTLESLVSDTAGTDLGPFFESRVRSTPETLDVPPPTVYDASHDGSDLSLSVADAAAEPGSSGTVRVTVTNDGTETGLAPHLTVEAPPTFETTDVRADGGSGDVAAVTPVDGGWALDHLDPGESVTVTAEFAVDGDTPTGDETIEWSVVDMSGNDDVTAGTVAVGDLPTAAFDAPAGVPVGETVAFDASASDEGQYRWTIAGPGTDSATATGPTLEYTFDEPGEYDVGLAVENGQGLVATANATVVASDRPRIAIEGPTTVDRGETATYSVDVDNEFGATDVRWEVFGETTDSDRLEVTFEQDATHKIRVTVTDEYGATGTANTTVTVGEGGPPDDAVDGEGVPVDDFGSGFGVVAAVLALAALAAGARR